MPRYRDPRPGEVFSFLSRAAAEAKPEGDGLEVRFVPSPCCGRVKQDGGSALVNTKTGLWFCHACQKAGNWFTLTRAFGMPLAQDDRYADGPAPVNFDAYKAMLAKMRRPVTGGQHPKLLEYCHGRGFTNATLDAWRVSTLGDKTLRWPIFARTADEKWQAANARMRVVLGRDEAAAAKETVDWFEVKGGTTDLCVGNHLLDFNGPKRVLIVEGQWDAMVAWQCGIANVLSLPNGAANVSVASMLRYIPEDWEVWLAVDMDKPGDKCAELFFAQLGPDRVGRLELPYKDLNEWLDKKGDLSADQILSCARGFTTSISRRRKAVEEVARSKFISLDAPDDDAKEVKIVCSTPWPRLTKRLGGGLRETQTMGILAPSGIGKTTVVGQLCVHAAAEGIQVGVIMLEGERDEAKKMLRRQLAGWTQLTGEAFKAAAARIMLSELEGKDVRWQDVNEEAQALCEAGAKLIIVDNYDYVSVGAYANDAKMQAYAGLQVIVKRYRAHGVVVWQPLKIDRTKVVNSGDQKGMSSALQDAAVYMNLNRFGPKRRIEIEKARVDDPDEVTHVWLTYNHQTGCLDEDAHQVEIGPVAALGVNEL